MKIFNGRITNWFFFFGSFECELRRFKVWVLFCCLSSFDFVLFQVSRGASTGFIRRKVPTLLFSLVFIDFFLIKPNFLGVRVYLLLEWLFCLSFRSVSLCFCLDIFGVIWCLNCWKWFYRCFWGFGMPVLNLGRW